MATVFFGNTTVGASAATGFNGITDGNKNQVFTCPGVGSVQVLELSLFSRTTVDTVGQIFRLAIYSEDRSTLICEGSSIITVSSDVAAWNGHVGAANLVPNPVSLVGGTNYTLVFTTSAADSQAFLS